MGDPVPALMMPINRPRKRRRDRGCRFEGGGSKIEAGGIREGRGYREGGGGGRKRMRGRNEYM
eukprot:5812999-Pyramimonas_sp.AAC.1